jgi:hypothetical protein
MVLIRQYEPTADYSALRACFVELQTWEQSLEPGLRALAEAADPYLAEVFRNCAENSGRIFLAEADGPAIERMGSFIAHQHADLELLGPEFARERLSPHHKLATDAAAAMGRSHDQIRDIRIGSRRLRTGAPSPVRT